MNAIAHDHIKPPRLSKQGFIARGAAPMHVAGGLVLAIRHRFHNHTPQQLSTCLRIHQQATDELGGTTSAGRTKKDWGRAGREWWLWEWLCGVVLRAYCGTRHRHQIEAIAQLIEAPKKLTSYSQCRLLAYRLKQTWQHHGCCRCKHFVD